MLFLTNYNNKDRDYNTLFSDIVYLVDKLSIVLRLFWYD